MSRDTDRLARAAARAVNVGTIAFVVLAVLGFLAGFFGK